MVSSFARRVSLLARNRCDGHGMSISWAVSHTPWKVAVIVDCSCAVMSHSTALTAQRFMSEQSASTNVVCSMHVGHSQQAEHSCMMAVISLPPRPGGMAMLQRPNFTGPRQKPDGTMMLHRRGLPLSMPQTRKDPHVAACKTASSENIMATSTNPALSMAVTASRSPGHWTHSTWALGICSYLLNLRETFTGSSRKPGVVPTRTRGRAAPPPRWAAQPSRVQQSSRLAGPQGMFRAGREPAPGAQRAARAAAAKLAG
mmetsp:Transcript_101351/g.327073  ORF Transcript_101351/g.327073 Transcript_101351/m.327073 type:complete len:257 (+) Transcript_101351:420-1190(+)